MIAVKWEFEGDDLEVITVQAAVERVLRRYQRALGSVRCPVHESGPLLIVRGRSLNDLDLSVQPCCQALVNEANARIQGARRRRRIASESDQTNQTNPERRTSMRRRAYDVIPDH
jgi:hypothetical protein